MRTRPQGAKRPEPQAERSERTRRPPTRPNASAGRFGSGLRASPAAYRAQRGPRRALSGGRRREGAERSAATERRATARVLQERRFRPDSGSGLAAQAGLLSTGPERLQERREEAGLVTDRRLRAELARDVPPVSLRILLARTLAVHSTILGLTLSIEHLRNWVTVP
jgi:hypothetical protein